MHLVRICCGRSTNCFLYSFVFQVISEKTLRYRFYKEFETHFLRKILTEKFSSIVFLFFCRNQKQESNFPVGGLVTRNNSAFFKVSRPILQRYAEFSRFLSKYFITCFIIVPCSQLLFLSTATVHIYQLVIK